MLQNATISRPMKLSEGKQIALRRKALGWKRQDQLAEKVPTSPSTIARVEGDDPGVSPAMKAAVWRAIEKEEAARGLVTGSDIAPSSNAVDAAHERQKMRLEDLRDTLASALEIVRRGLAEYDEGRDSTRKRG